MTGKDLINMIEELGAEELDVVVFSPSGLLKDAAKATVVPVSNGSKEEFSIVIE